MVSSDLDLWSEATGAVAVAVLIPFYMGVQHLTLVQLLTYGGVAGLLLAAGEHLRFTGLVPPSAREFVADLLLWAQAVLGLGTASYLIAVILI
ncbi:hypothetical protein [Sphingosinicella terrae]|jgi:hypothetical protein|uniref:hypothetical protein n=1 Tax=Sphingosinicella terrae TaxID=2172047 RepID=UPI000E0D681F|nr:hypothetical protein [Sphingosinicella terrae]